MLEQYAHKIMPVAEIREAAGARPRSEKLVMCHGTFDLVHPGHIRHLLWAKAQGSKLLVSVTADRYVTKANRRPHVPEDLRALNLAVLDFVDFVLIDGNPTPLENLAGLQPDIFVKGHEYQAGGLHPKSREEKETVEAYGGEMRFSPGDVVYSSSAIIRENAPNISVDRMVNEMRRAGLGADDLTGALDRLGRARVHVVGDLIIDTLTRTDLIGASGKTPTMSVRHKESCHFVGGAGVVAKHLKAAGLEVTFTTLMGDDELAGFARRDLEAAGVDVQAIVQKGRPTTNKNAIEASGYRLLKLDTLDNSPIAEDLIRQVRGQIADIPADMVVFSDFRHGLFHRDSIPVLTRAVPDGVLTVADSQVASRWGNILDFKGFDLITPNEKEARFALGEQDLVAGELGERLFEAANCRLLVMSLGRDGALAYHDGDGGLNRIALQGLSADIVDPVGAGDAMLAYTAAVLQATNREAPAVILGQIAASLACERDGNIPVTVEDIRDRLAHLLPAVSANL